MTAAVNPSEVPPGGHLYGNLARPPVFGLTRWLGPVGTKLIYLGMGAAALASMKSLLAAALIVAGTAVLIALMSARNRYHQNGLTLANIKIGKFRTRRRKAHIYRAGPYGQIPHGKYQLPGIAAPTQVTEWQTPHQTDFAVVTIPEINDHTVVMTTDPDGGSLVDPEQTDQRVSRNALWLAQLGRISGCVQATLTLEVARDSGSRLRQEVQSQEAKDVHPFAHDVGEEIIDTYPEESYTTRGYASITFAGHGPSGRRNPDEIGRDLQVRMAGLVSSLNGTGAGAVRPASVADLSEIVHTAFNPDAANTIAEARAHGRRLPLSWDNIGPAAMHEFLELGHLWHDGHLSKVWTLVDPPDGYFREDILEDLLSPHPNIDRFRLTTLYHPLGPIRTAQAVKSAVNNASRRVDKPRADANDIKDLAVAQQTANEVAHGAGLLNFSSLITATVGPGVDYEGRTVLPVDRMRVASAEVEALCAGAGLTVRPLWGEMSAGFTIGLGVLGIIPSRYQSIDLDVS